MMVERFSYRRMITSKIAGEFDEIHSFGTVTSPPIKSERPAPPYLFAPKVSTNGVEIKVPTVPNRQYHLEWKEHLGEAEWKTGRTVTGTGSHVEILDAAGNVRTRFYRVRAQ
jgi:hypothetical protein